MHCSKERLTALHSIPPFCFPSLPKGPVIEWRCKDHFSVLSVYKFQFCKSHMSSRRRQPGQPGMSYQKALVGIRRSLAFLNVNILEAHRAWLPAGDSAEAKSLSILLLLAYWSEMLAEYIIYSTDCSSCCCTGIIGVIIFISHSFLYIIAVYTRFLSHIGLTIIYICKALI